MGYVMKTDLSRKENYGGERSISKIKYIVIHYTGNDGDHDEGNSEYFRGTVVKASAHYFVDDDSITQTVPDNYIAWSVGGRKWKDCDKTGGGKFHGIVNNTNSLNIEMCDTQKDGRIMATETTMRNAADLCKKLMKQYNIDINHVVRHFDVTGKHCPAYFMDEQAWIGFKNRLANSEEKTDEKDDEKPVKPTTPISFNPYMVRVKISNLNIRKGPGTNYARVSTIKPGIYTIVDEQSGIGSNNGWGKLKSGVGWISLDYITKI